MEADAVCRQVLAAQPNLPEAEHLLGVIAHQNGKLNEAIEHVQRATKLAPHVALFHANLGEMFRLAGRPRLAVGAGAARARSRAGDAGGLEQSRCRALRTQRLRGSGAGAAQGHRRQPGIRRSALESRQCVACAAPLRGSHRRVSPRHRAQTRLCRRLGQSRHYAAPFRPFRRRHRHAAARHRARAASRQRPFRPRHSAVDARRFRRRLGRIRVAAALDRAHRPALSGAAVAGRESRRQAHLCPGRAGFRRHAAVRPLPAAPRRPCRQRDGARASAAGHAAAREPARHHGARRPRRSGALSLRRRAAEPAAPVQDPARNHSRRSPVSASAGGIGATVERASRRHGRTESRRGVGGQSGTCQRYPPLDRSAPVGTAVRRAWRLLREPASRAARRRPEKAAARQEGRSRQAGHRGAVVRPSPILPTAPAR